WKWIVLGASVVVGFLLALFSKWDWALRVLAVLAVIVLALAGSLFAVALHKSIKESSPNTAPDSEQAVPHGKPKKYQMAIAIVLVILAIIGVVWGSGKRKDAPLAPIPVKRRAQEASTT